ncbi:MAG TPA: RNA polymerase sigma factor, partial [Isosphaeraceae bacterium]|nr:RNA polymerase sigma factor [Isosphaeraceae bacterium]
MARGSMSAELVNQLNTLSQVGVVGDLSDGQLLERLVTARDETAQAVFTALVERHGPMVLRVCRQVLGDSHDAQDAFQATFLVLARKAGSVRKVESIASWLHGVALRVSVRAKADEARRKMHERRGGAMKAAESMREREGPESWPELHREIARLPERYREPVVLCYVEGLATQAAAARIGCPHGTVLSRLSRAREQLRRRLTRRHIALPAGLLTAALAPEPASAALPPALLAETVRASLQFAGRRATEAAMASATATTLARGVLYTMMISKLKMVGAATLACVLALGGMRTLAFQLGGGNEPAEQAKSKAGAADPRAALARLAEKLEAELDASAKRSQELRKELQALKAELKALPTATPPAARKQAGASSAAPAQSQYMRFDKYIIGASPQGDKVFTYNTETKQTRFLRLAPSDEPPPQVIPQVGPGGAWLYLKGREIDRIAVVSASTGDWYTQDLREPVDGEAIPILTVMDFSQVGLDSGRGPRPAFVYGSGRYAYGFSFEAK